MVFAPPSIKRCPTASPGFAVLRRPFPGRIGGTRRTSVRFLGEPSDSLTDNLQFYNKVCMEKLAGHRGLQKVVLLEPPDLGSFQTR